MTVIEISKQITEITDADRARCERRHRWYWVEASIWTDAMLTALENGVKGGKWFSLIDKVYKTETLNAAWQKVKSNKGAAGVDKISIQQFEAKQKQYLAEIEQELKNDTYRPKAVRREYIPKGQGKMRPLGIPTIKDRTTQQAVKAMIEPIFEKEFLGMSYGFRPGKGAKQAITEVSKLIDEGYTWVVDADLQSYFDTIPHLRLMDKVQKRISDGRILMLIEMWLKNEVMEECKNWIPDRGTPQGGVISPLLSNIYLHDLDVLITNAGYKMIRYADDFVVLTTSEAEAKEALRTVQEWAKENGLTIHPEKTHIGNCQIEGQGFDFLGYRFESGTRWIRKKSIQKFRDRIRQETSRVCGKAITKVIETLNPILRGWSNYFVEVTKYTLGTFDSFVRRRLRAIIARQQKRQVFGAGRENQRIPNSYFAKLGLFNMEAYQVQCKER
jgi:RNA-directed DNA polymerase